MAKVFTAVQDKDIGCLLAVPVEEGGLELVLREIFKHHSWSYFIVKRVDQFKHLGFIVFSSEAPFFKELPEIYKFDIAPGANFSSDLGLA